MTDRQPSSIDDFLPGIGTQQFRAMIVALLDHEADLRERLGHMEINQRISETPMLKSRAETICNLPRHAAKREVEEILVRIEDLELEIEGRLR